MGGTCHRHHHMGSAPTKAASTSVINPRELQCETTPTQCCSSAIDQCRSPTSPSDPHSIEWLLWKLSQTEEQERVRLRRKKEQKQKQAKQRKDQQPMMPLQSRKVNHCQRAEIPVMSTTCVPAIHHQENCSPLIRTR